ncbi:DUF3037 domain-containing protein [Roseinatronobacter alkalisoli]|uniref:DUF3037 domain-containing protein n=1 Tax=Roseinatronobacter alkalisoli TaxID=3028235 RepID=A0ABT5THR8_9RHOB|nr:DUF3037 domain-containing protein [Roseinatronobacter sp. HJB301]MDD7973921.1 DUF3037 domain-containing protein [Roseinatronobacter sp. HJB301]
MNRSAYTYTVLQYRHDAWSGECMNVGILFFCPKSQYVDFKFRRGGSRLSNAYPSLNRSALLQDLKEMSRWFDRRASQPSDMWMWKSALELGHSLLGDDDSSFRWNLDGSGTTNDPEKTISLLFERFVMRYDAVPGRSPRTDEQVFDTVKDKLKRAQLLNRMESYTVRTKFTEVTFEHAIKNGKWHCIQAISLDSADADNMQRKAERWAGKMVGLLEADNVPQVYLVTGKPTEAYLQSKYEKMTEWLRHNPANPVVIEEEQSETLISRLATLT